MLSVLAVTQFFSRPTTHTIYTISTKSNLHTNVPKNSNYASPLNNKTLVYLVTIAAAVRLLGSSISQASLRWVSAV